MKTVLIAVLLLASQNIFAGDSQLVGTGRATAPADFVELTATVSAECYLTAGEAVNAANAMAQQVYTVLQAAANSSLGDDVYTQGGFAAPFSKNIYTDTNTSGTTVCGNTFQSQSTITLKTFDVKGFAAAFTMIQNALYAPGFQKPAVDSASPIAYTVLGQPSPEWTEQTRAAVETQAAQLAIDDAKTRMAAYAVEACVSQWSISRINDGAPVQNVPYGDGNADLGVPVSTPGPVVNFEPAWLSRSVTVDFVWDGGRADQPCNVVQTGK